MLHDSSRPDAATSGAADGDESAMVRVRPAVPGDAQEVADLFWQIRLECVPAIPMIVPPRDTVMPFIRDHMMAAPSEVHVAVTPGHTSGDIVGFLAISPGHLDHLYLRAAWTGGGLGSRLVDLAKTLHPKGLELWAFQSNARAIAFYARHGFVDVEWTDGDNMEGAPDVRMVWSPA